MTSISMGIPPQDMIKVIDIVSLDTLGVKIFHVDSKGSCPICGMPKLIGVFTGRIYYYHVYCPHCKYDQKWSDVDCGVYEARNP